MKTNHIQDTYLLGMDQISLDIPTDTFILLYKSIFTMFPGLHPDECDNPDGGWPIELKQWARTAFELRDKDKIGDGDLYPFTVALDAVITNKRVLAILGSTNQTKEKEIK